MSFLESNAEKLPLSGQRYYCTVCKISFTKKFNFRRHVRKKHDGDFEKFFNPVNENGPHPNAKYKCDLCSRSYTKNYILQRHKGRSHGQSDSLKRMHTCVLCKNNFELKDINQHFETAHDVEINYETHEFVSVEEFLTWKSNMEKKSKYKYLKYAKRESANGKSYSFVCHRSGNFVTNSKGLRNLKIQGSNKINGYCPAIIKVKENEKGQCAVSFQTSHVGHQNDLAHLPLTKKEREYVASKIAANIPFNNILDEIKVNVSNSGLERLHLLTKKDLHNMQRDFQLASSNTNHKNDCFNVDIWVKEAQVTDCILLYKPVGTKNTNTLHLEDDDFLLSIMTDGQAEMLKKFGGDVICIDSTHSVNAYGYELITLIVVDDLHQGFPCAFLITSRTDYVALAFFFSKVKEKVGFLSPKVFMSDMTESYFLAWSHVMSATSMRLFCTWHVDSEWRKNLTKIKGTDKQASTYGQLRSLLQETDILTFKIFSEALLKSLDEDPDTVEFANYLKMHYMKNPEYWAYCYHINAGINTNMDIENMHITLKHTYLSGKNMNCLDKAISGMMRLVQDKMIDRSLISNKGKIASKLRALYNRHKASLKLSLQVLSDDDGWLVSSENNKHVYQIKQVEKNCQCQLLCVDCGACLHMFLCTCIDSSIKFNMCKHIHFLCRKKKETRNTMPNEIEDNELLENEDSTNTMPDEFENNESYDIVTENGNEIMTKELFHKNMSHSLSIQERIKKIEKDYNNMIKSASESEQLDVLENTFRFLQTEMNSLKVRKSKRFCPINQPRPANENIPQSSFVYENEKKQYKEISTTIKEDEILSFFFKV